MTHAPRASLQGEDVEELQYRIMEECERLDQRVIDNAVNKIMWRKRLHAGVAENGGHFYRVAWNADAV